MWLLTELEKLRGSQKTAIVHREERITFQNLWDRSDKLAGYIDEVCKSKAPIVIYGNKDIDITVAMIASLKTGRAYIPVDVTFPVERLRIIMNMVHCELLINFSGLQVDGPYQCLEKGGLYQMVYMRPCAAYPTNRMVQPDHPCYILFTSGSTGVPKGVTITRRNIENFVNWFRHDCEAEDIETILNQVSYSFDVSVIALYIYLPMGKTLFNIDKEMMEDTKTLFQYLKKSGLTVWISTPAFLEICSFDDGFSSAMLPNLKKFILAGEVLTKKLVRTIWRKFAGAEVYNGYGPTEGTVLLSACRITEDMMNASHNLPIGKVIPEAEYWIAAENAEGTVPGHTGELVVVSNSISQGYYENHEQTTKAFFRHADGRTGYKTGDLVFEEHGLLYYVARKDFQIKLNGFRIELEDISNNLNAIDFVSSSVVLPVYKQERVGYIAAFVTLHSQPESSHIKTALRIKKELRGRIPSYMVPRRIVILEKFPLNTNGKIDRQKLLEDL